MRVFGTSHESIPIHISIYIIITNLWCVPTPTLPGSHTAYVHASNFVIIQSTTFRSFACTDIRQSNIEREKEFDVRQCRSLNSINCNLNIEWNCLHFFLFIFLSRSPHSFSTHRNRNRTHICVNKSLGGSNPKLHPLIEFNYDVHDAQQNFSHVQKGIQEEQLRSGPWSGGINGTIAMAIANKESLLFGISMVCGHIHHGRGHQFAGDSRVEVQHWSILHLSDTLGHHHQYGCRHFWCRLSYAVAFSSRICRWVDAPVTITDFVFTPTTFDSFQKT